MIGAKRLALRGLDRLARACGAAARAETRACDGLTILMYHKVLPDALVGEYPLRNLVVPESVFARQMEWLESHCEPCVMSDGVDEMGGPIGTRPRVAVTFDDGYLDNAEVAAPILRRVGVCATFFVTSGFVDGTPLWFDVAAGAHATDSLVCVQEAVTHSSDLDLDSESFPNVGAWMGWLKRQSPDVRESIIESFDDAATRERPMIFGAMSPTQIGSLDRAGHEIGSHSVSHPILVGLKSDRLLAELGGARRAIGAWIDSPVRSFCYPNGDFDDRVVEAVRQAGYDSACTTRRGLNRAGDDRLTLRRRFITDANSGTTLAFASETLGVHDMIRRLRSTG